MRLAFSIFLASLTLPCRASDPVEFNRDIRPILSEKCLTCHGPDANAREAELRLDTRQGLFANRKGLPAVTPGRLDRSAVIERITATDPEMRMPPLESKLELTQQEIATLKQWVSQGASWARHWSFEPVRRPVLPQVSMSDWCRNGIDRYVLARLEGAGLMPAVEAGRTTLIRRVTLDLTGLPANPQDINAFLGDRSPGAYQQVVDRLLESPRFGEHMAWFWLDAARYADSDGYESDPLRNMWPWRDWVVAAFNTNMSYDQFIIRQLAGDLLDEVTLRTRLATGFNRNHRLNNEGGILPEEWLVEYVCDRAETTATVFMGLTWGCARCHDHKYDPITQRDYYRLFAFFHNVPEKGSARGSNNAEPMLLVSRLEHLAQFEVRQKELDALNGQLDQRAQSTEFKTFYQDWLSALLSSEKTTGLPKSLAEVEPEKWDTKHKNAARRFCLTTKDVVGSGLELRISPLREQQNALAKDGAKVMVMAEMAQPRQTHLLIRGAYNQPGEVVSAGTPVWLPAWDASEPRDRLGFARWLTRPDHPLTSRVAVNRFWERFFGSGLVRTQENFGSQGGSPTHPGLLDWLAWTFMESGWNTKALMKRIVMSATYRQTSQAIPEMLKRDPENRLLARAPRYRLPAAVIRDQALALSGLLVGEVGGPPVKPYQPDGLWREVIKGSPTYRRDTGTKLYRRSLYSLWRRAVKPPLMMLLDANERDTCRVSQRRTNTPLQALLLLNSVTFVETARGLATRIIQHGGESNSDRIRYGMKLTTARFPTVLEQRVLEESLTHWLAAYAADEHAGKALVSIGESTPDASIAVAELAAWTALSRVLLNLDETVTKE